MNEREMKKDIERKKNIIMNDIRNIFEEEDTCSRMLQLENLALMIATYGSLLDAFENFSKFVSSDVENESVTRFFEAIQKAKTIYHNILSV